MNTNVLLSVIVPVFNEEAVLGQASSELGDALDRVIGEGGWEFVFVENGSTDRTPEVLREISNRWPRTRTVTLPRSNYGAALRAGLLDSGAPWAHIINVDYFDIPFLVWAWQNRERYDLFLGSKLADPTLYQWSGYRRFISWGFNAILRLVFDLACADTHGPKLLRMETMKPVLCACVMSRGQFDTEFVLRGFRSGLWIAEAPTLFAETRPSRNFMIRKIAQNVWDLFALYRAIVKLPYAGPIKFRRYARADLEAEEGGLAAAEAVRAGTEDGTSGPG